MTEQDLLVDCLRRLNTAAIAYMLTGSMVSNYWGIPRTTHDLDLVIQLPPRDVPKLSRAFSGEFFLQEESILAAYAPPHQFNALDTRSALKVDFWLLQPAPFEQQMFSRRLRIALFGEPAWIGTAEDVILHKLYWNRITPSDRQLGDAAGIVAIQGAVLDRSYLEHWATALDVQVELTQLLSGAIRPKQT